MNLLKRVLNKGVWVLLACLCAQRLVAQIDTAQYVIKDRTNDKAQQKKPYVILISADGFRYDYAQKYNATHLLGYAAKGVAAESMAPSFPSLTFPNHYTLATGLYPAHSGLVGNRFYSPDRNDTYVMSAKDKVRDGSWYGGTPIWVLAEQQKMLSASFYWVGSEAPIKNTFPTYYYHYNELISNKNRIQTVKNWLMMPAEKRPHLITFYFPEVDHAGHEYGPDAPETGKAVAYIDEQIDELVKAVKETGLNVNFIFVSDHGMTEVDRKHPIPSPAAIVKEKFTVVYAGTMINLYAKDTTAILPTYNALKEVENGDYRVYLKKDVPTNLHFGAADDKYDRIGDIILISIFPKVFSDRTPIMGHHGFDPNEVKNMGATFMAWGPNIKKGLKIATFPNVDVYPVISKILKLKITEPIDGKNDVAKKIVKK